MASLGMRLRYPIAFGDFVGYPVDLSRTREFPPIGHAVRGEDGLLRMDFAKVGKPELGIRENPSLTAWDALASLQRGEPERFRAGAERLAALARPDGSGGIRWEVDFPWEEKGARLEPPWAYGLAQGLASSVMVRAWKAALGERYRELALAAAPAFGQDGILVRSGPDVFLEMYPVRPPGRVLDGHGFLLQGLRDLASIGAPGASGLASEALETLGRRIGDWDWKGIWSTYGVGDQLASGFYHALNHAWVSAFAAWAPGCAALERAAKGWDPHRLGAADRARIYLAFKGKALRDAVSAR